jgi:PAS domain S-box-containing protein/putative nucleotidyltransferase with HDIG domain
VIYSNADSAAINVAHDEYFTYHERRDSDRLYVGRPEPGNPNGVARFVSYRTLVGYPLIVAVGTSQSEVLAPFHTRARDYRFAAGLASVLIGLFGIAAVAGSHRRKRAVAALHESTARYSATFNQVAVGIAHSSLGLKIIAANPALCAMLGYSESELLGRRLLDITHPDDVVASQQLGDAVAGTGTASNCARIEKRYLRNDGSVIWTADSVALARDIHGNPAYYITVVHDISERKRMETLLCDNERHFRSLIENSADLVLVIDPAGTIKYSSPSVMRMGGYAASELLGRSILDFMHPEDIAAATADLRTIVLHPESPLRADRRVRHRSGRWMLLESIAKNALDDPSIAGIVVNARDVTTRREAERDLVFKNSVLSTQQETSPDGILLVDENAKILSFNRKFVDIFGIPEDLVRVGDHRAVLGFALQRVEDPEQCLAKVEELYRNREARSRDEISFKDGKVVDRFSSPVIGRDRTYYGRVWYFREITAQRQAERALAKVHRARCALSQFSGVLVHAKDEAELIQAMCDSIVTIGGYRFAWVGLVEHDASKTIRAVAHAGYESGYIGEAHVTWDDVAPGRGPVGTAVRTARLQVVQDIQTDASFAPWRDKAAARGYRSIVALPLLSGVEPIGVLAIYASEVNAFDGEELALLNDLAEDLGYGLVTLRTRIAHEKGSMRLLKSMEATVLAMAATMESRDAYTAGHQRRVADLAVAIARELRLPQDDVDGLHFAAIVHDLGKIQIPAEILSKPGSLTPIEYQLIKEHPETGYNILKTVDFPWPIAEIVRQHHERLDGSGYPHGLKGDAILMCARILAVADTVEAMAAHRPYRPGLGVDKALEHVASHRGTSFDAAAVDACLRLFAEKRFSFSP